jgi:hypothetical protein
MASNYATGDGLATLKAVIARAFPMIALQGIGFAGTLSR